MMRREKFRCQLISKQEKYLYMQSIYTIELNVTIYILYIYANGNEQIKLNAAVKDIVKKQEINMRHL